MRTDNANEETKGYRIKSEQKSVTSHWDTGKNKVKAHFLLYLHLHISQISHVTSHPTPQQTHLDIRSLFMFLHSIICHYHRNHGLHYILLLNPLCSNCFLHYNLDLSRTPLCFSTSIYSNNFPLTHQKSSAIFFFFL